LITPVVPPARPAAPQPAQWSQPPLPPVQWAPPPPAPGRRLFGLPLWAVLAGLAVLLLLLFGAGGVAVLSFLGARSSSATATAAAVAAASATADARVAARATAAVRASATAGARARATAAALAEAESATAAAATAEVAALVETATALAAAPIPAPAPTTDATQVAIARQLAPITAGFSQNEGWYSDQSDEVDFGLVDGAYRFTIKVPNQIAWDEFKQQPTLPNYVVRVTGRVRENKGGLYALFNYKDDGKNFYAFGINSDGSYRLTGRQGGTLLSADLIPWKQSAAIRPGLEAENNLEVVRRGALMELYINDQLVETFRDDRFSGGFGGVAGESFDQTGSVIEITGFTITPLALSDFQDTSNPEGWDQENSELVTGSLDGNALLLHLKQTESAAYASRRYNLVPTANFMLQADIASVQNERDVAAGLFFNYDKSSESYYRLLVWSGGKYTLALFRNGEAELLVDWTDDANIRQGTQVNSVRVERVEASLLVSINGVPVKRLDGLQLQGGAAGVAAISFQDGAGGTLAFDNVGVAGLP
jgi:hypothetical protein